MSAPEPEHVLTRHEHYRLGRVPVRIAYNQEDAPFMAEVPARDGKSGLVIDNRYIFDILMGAPDDLEEIETEEFEALLKSFKR